MVVQKRGNQQIGSLKKHFKVRV